ncbi:putative transcription factor interactor and regulator CCHC(Zn) family [Helianthus anomalus]
MKIGFDKAKVTCFKCIQKGHYKRECTNNKADDSVNLFHEDYYKKAIYHHNNEQPSRKQIEEGSSKEKKQGILTIYDVSTESSTIQDDNKWRIQEDEGSIGTIILKMREKNKNGCWLLKSNRAERKDMHA